MVQQIKKFLHSDAVVRLNVLARDGFHDPSPFRLAARRLLSSGPLDLHSLSLSYSLPEFTMLDCWLFGHDTDWLEVRLPFRQTFEHFWDRNYCVKNWKIMQYARSRI
jgi:hypothetical protein